MKRHVIFSLLVAAMATTMLFGQTKFESDTLQSRDGNIVFTFLGHGSLMVTFKDQVVYFDPVSRYGDFSKMPKASLILITHEHGDHLDGEVLATLRTDKTTIVLTQACAPGVPNGLVMSNGETRTVRGIKIEAVPAYNIVHMRTGQIPFHPKGTGNGYVITLGGKRIYVAGDTENIPEMSQLGIVDCAFLPMNLPYTMTPEMVAEAAKRIKPRILYPYHFGTTETARLVELLKDQKGMEIRVRKMQ